MRQIERYRKLLWPIAIGTCFTVVLLSFIFTYMSDAENWAVRWLSFPLIPLLPIIIAAFIIGVRRVQQALDVYSDETIACTLVEDGIKDYSTPGDFQARLASVIHGTTTIGKRIAHALSATDVDMASAIMRLPQPMDVEEDKTFGELQFWRSALVLIGLLSTVVFFAMAFHSAETFDEGSLLPLKKELQRALTMTMAGIATSVVLGGMSTHLFDIQQDLKLKVDELTALMLPRLLPHYEKGTHEEPGPALVLEKLQDFFREVEGWKSDVGADVGDLTRVLVEHREVLAGLPAVSLPKGFDKLTTSLTQVSNATTEMREVTDRALKVLAESRDLDLNNIVNLLAEIRLDSERVKSSQQTLLDKVLPRLAESSEQLKTLNNTLGEVGAGLKKNVEMQEALLKTNRLIQKELSRIDSAKDEQLLAKMQEMVDGIDNLRRETARANDRLRSSSTYTYREPSGTGASGMKAAPPPVKPEGKPVAGVVYKGAPPRVGGERSRWNRIRDWFSDRFEG